MELSQIIPHIESLIFAADRPLPLLEILDLLNNALAFLEDRASLEQVETALDAIKEKYSSEFYPFEVRESGGGYQFLTKKEYYQTVAQLNGEKFLKRLSTAALETLAIVAYKQPISKGEIEHIRGVSTDYSIQKLLEKELIVISGRSETLPGKPLLYSTSKAFMDYFGLNSPKDLPKLKEVFEDESIQPTLVSLDGNTESPDDSLNMVVSETGELVERDLLHDNSSATGLNGHHADLQEEIPVVDEDLPVKDLEDTEENEPAASAVIPVVVEDIPTVDEEQGETTEDKEDNEEDSQNTGEDNTSVADDDNVVATEDEIAAFLAAAADLGPKDEEDEEDEDEEDFEDDEDDEDEDGDEEDDDDDDFDEDEDDEDSDEDDEDDDFDDEDEDEEGDDADDEDVELEDDEEGGKEEDVDDEGFYKDGDFGDDDDEEDDDDDKK